MHPDTNGNTYWSQACDHSGAAPAQTIFRQKIANKSSCRRAAAAWASPTSRAGITRSSMNGSTIGSLKHTHTLSLKPNSKPNFRPRPVNYRKSKVKSSPLQALQHQLLGSKLCTANRVTPSPSNKSLRETRKVTPESRQLQHVPNRRRKETSPESLLRSNLLTGLVASAKSTKRTKNSFFACNLVRSWEKSAKLSRGPAACCSFLEVESLFVPLFLFHFFALFFLGGGGLWQCSRAIFVFNVQTAMLPHEGRQ